jgi:hypothetical protein
MLIDLDSAPDFSWNTDTIVVGSGAVGLTIGVELARAGHHVTILEAGGLKVSAPSQSFFTNAKSGAMPLKGLHLGRFRALGGTTNFWGGQLVEFDEAIFAERPWLGYPAWPLAKSDIAPFYTRAYDLLGLGKRLDRAAIWQRLKIAPPTTDSEPFEDFFSAWSPEPNLAQLFRHEIATDPKLSIVVNAPVVALEAEPAASRISGLCVVGRNGTLHSCKGKRIILANGTIEMARLLKLPLADGRQPIWSTNPWLGTGFVDHIDCRAGMAVPFDKKRFHDIFDNAFLDGIKYVPKLRLTASAQRENSLLDACACFLFDSALGDHIANAKILARALLRGHAARQTGVKPRELLAMAPLIFPMIFRYLRHRRMYNPADLGIQLRIACEQHPAQTSALSLLDETDMLGMPVIKLDWQIDGREIETIAYFAERLKSAFEASKLAKLSLDPKLIARDRTSFQTMEDSNHHMGMVRLGTSVADGVVDRDLRVFGTDNLYAAGAAVFPTTGFANPTLTAIALGLRLAEHIVQERAD